MIIKILPKEKHSQSHIEMIISFSLFIGVLIIVFIFMNPIINSAIKEKNVDMDKKILIDKMSSNIGKLSIFLKDENNCYEIPEDYGKNFIEVLDYPKKYTVYFSPDLNIGKISCYGKPAVNYTLGSYSNDAMIIYNKTINLKNDYESDYLALKKNLGFDADFSWSFKNLDGIENPDLSVVKDIAYPRNVYVDDVPVRVIDESGNVHEMMLVLKIW